MAATGVAGLLDAIGGRRVALLTGPTGWLGAAGHLADILHEAGLLRALLAPEHGIRGDLQAGAHVADSVDPRTGVPVYSIYPATVEPPPAALDGVGAVVAYLQDSGCRGYTFMTNLARCLAACAAAGLPLLLLDRPTPLGPARQGNVAGDTFFPVALPLRLGLSHGDLLRLLVHEQGLDVDLTIVPLVATPRQAWYDQTGLPWVLPSPNLPTLDSALCFCGTVLLEGTNASEGRGTTRPFELVGAPWLSAEALAAELNRRELPGLLARPASFTPTFSKHAGELCHGVQLHVTDRDRCELPLVGLHVIHAMRAAAPEDFAFRPYFDKLCDDPAVREQLEAGEPPAAIAAAWPAQLAEFAARLVAAGLPPG